MRDFSKVMRVARWRVLFLGVLAVVLAACTGTAQLTPPTTHTGTTAPPIIVPTVDLAVTPKGWVPVAVGGAQISIPARWSVSYGSWSCPSKSSAGSLFVDPVPEKIVCGPSRTQTLVSISPSPVSAANQKGSARRINGIPVSFEAPRCLATCPLVINAPKLGVHLSLVGPMSVAVLNTLTRSPYQVVFESGPAPRVPSSWRWISSFGIRFAVPATWPVRTALRMPESCGPYFVEDQLPPERVMLVDAKLFAPMFNCSLILSTTHPVAPYEGLEVITGRYAPREERLPSIVRLLTLHGLRAAAWTLYSSLLTLVVYGKPEVGVELGLAGNGLIARTILSSIQPAGD